MVGPNIYWEHQCLNLKNNLSFLLLEETNRQKTSYFPTSNFKLFLGFLFPGHKKTYWNQTNLGDHFYTSICGLLSGRLGTLVSYRIIMWKIHDNFCIFTSVILRFDLFPFKFLKLKALSLFDEKIIKWNCTSIFSNFYWVNLYKHFFHSCYDTFYKNSQRFLLILAN